MHINRKITRKEKRFGKKRRGRRRRKRRRKNTSKLSYAGYVPYRKLVHCALEVPISQIINPRPPEVFSVTCPPKGGLLQPPPPGFSIRNVLYPYVCYQCIAMDLLYSYESPLSIDIKISIIRLRMTSLRRHHVSATSKF